uniref:BTB domain-containing protein n=1 Tax=Ditylenchus dipsaci TaxID=166011 RepID=A0A915DQJ8_9BILA
MSLGGTLTTDRNAPTINSRKQRVYDDFSSPTAIRQDRIIVENKSIYVNLGYLAEYSSFFANSYEQKRESYSGKKLIMPTSVLFIDLANEFDMEPVMRRCEDVYLSSGSISATVIPCRF